MGRLSLSLAIVVAVVLAGAALAFRLFRAGGGAGAGGDGGGSGSEFLPILFAAAGLCTAGLLRRRAPAGAWLATVAAGGIAALEILAAVRAQEATDAPGWPSLVLVAEAALLGAAAIAAGYAIAPRSERAGSDARASQPRTWTRRAWRLSVLVGLAVVAGAGAWSAVQELDATGIAADPSSADLPPLRVSARLAAGFVVVMALAGIWLDLRGPLARARARSSSASEFGRSFAEELLPGAAAARRNGRDEERARLAADLHALVLPDLRRAARAAEAAEAADDVDSDAPQRDGSAPSPRARPVAADLRQAVEGVERLMHERQSIVLEEYGLVAGLEWLAERTQQRDSLVVDIELDGADVGRPAAIAAPIARAAYRVALLALDNVVRHAGADRAVIRLEVDAGRGRLSIVDDGRGIETAADVRGGRGLIDMRTAASEVGATIAVKRRDGGTAVEMTWHRPPGTAEDSATPVSDVTTDRPPSPNP